MSAKPIPRLDASIIARKGEAAPAAATSLSPSISLVEATPERGTIAVTVRLDPTRYERMKLHGARTRKTNQAILVAALDAFLRE